MTEALQQIQQIRDQARQLYSLQEVDIAIGHLASALQRDFHDKYPVCLTVMNGGLIFAGRLLPLLDFALQTDYLHTSRYLEQPQGGSIEWKVTPELPLDGRHVIVLDDILDVGETLLTIKQSCLAQGAASVTSAVMLEKHHDRKASPELKADYKALDIEDVFVFGCGLDYKHHWRNAPGIFAVS